MRLTKVTDDSTVIKMSDIIYVLPRHLKNVMGSALLGLGGIGVFTVGAHINAKAPEKLKYIGIATDGLAIAAVGTGIIAVSVPLLFKRYDNDKYSFHCHIDKND